VVVVVVVGTVVVVVGTVVVVVGSVVVAVETVVAVVGTGVVLLIIEPTPSHGLRVVSLDKEQVVLLLSYVTPWQYSFKLRHLDTHFSKL